MSLANFFNVRRRLVSSVGRTLDFCAGGFEPQTRSTLTEENALP